MGLNFSEKIFTFESKAKREHGDRDYNIVKINGWGNSKP